MNWFKKKAAADERIVNLKNSIYKEAYMLVMLICSVSIVIKAWFMKEQESVMVEFLVLLGGSLYFCIRSVALGIYSDEVEVHDQRSKMPFSLRTAIAGLVIGLTLALFLGVRSAVLFGNDSQTAWKYFFIVFLVSLVIYIPLFVGTMTAIHHIANRVSRAVSQNDQIDS